MKFNHLTGLTVRHTFMIENECTRRPLLECSLQQSRPWNRYTLATRTSVYFLTVLEVQYSRNSHSSSGFQFPISIKIFPFPYRRRNILNLKIHKQINETV